MTAHAESHAGDAAHGSHGDHANLGEVVDPRVQAAIDLKFEPSEVRDFELADKAAGQMMGKLLAFLFCVLLFLMTGVNIWMTRNAAKGTDPQVWAEVQGHDSHSKESAHH